MALVDGGVRLCPVAAGVRLETGGALEVLGAGSADTESESSDLSSGGGVGSSVGVGQSK